MSEREWRFDIDDMLHFAEKVQAYSAGLDQTQFENDELKYDAIVRNLELIAEAATHVPNGVREDSPTIPWRQLIASGYTWVGHPAAGPNPITPRCDALRLSAPYDGCITR